MDKYFFLDIDGVINLDDWCKESIEVLNDILVITGAKVVMSSDWRRNHTITQLQNILVREGFTGEIFDMTPESEKTCAQFLERTRAREIEKYREEHGITSNYVIVDDMAVYNNKFIPGTTNDEHFVRTFFYRGLKEDGLKEKIIKILNNG